MDLSELALTDEQRRAVEAALDEAFHQLADARAEVERRDAHDRARVTALRYRARDADVVARLLDGRADIAAQCESLRATNPYLFEPLAAESGGAQLPPTRTPPPKRDMNSVLRGEHL